MNMGYVFAVFGTLLALGIAFPGLLLAWSSLFPATVERARLRLGRTPWRCFALGAALVALAALPLGILLALPSGLAKLLGWAGALLLLTGASAGATGLAALMSERLGAGARATASDVLRGAIALELAAIFPLIGWFVLLPVAAVCSLGAAAFALLGRKPRAAPAVGDAAQAARV